MREFPTRMFATGMSRDRPVSRLPATQVDETLLLVDTGVKWGISMPSRRTAFGALAAITVALAGCGHAIQTTSGADYLSGYPEAGLAEETAIDQRVREVAAVEPTLRLPARIGLARIDNGDLSPIPAEEAEAWANAAHRLGPAFGEFVPVNLLVAEILSPSAPARKADLAQLRDAVEKIRIAAARQHMDAVLIYQTHYTADSADTVLSIVDWTIIGAFMLPGQSIEATAFASALLIDVRNGYPYGTADAVVDRDTLSTTFGRRAAGAELGGEARAAAALELVTEVEQMMFDLKQELDVADATLDETWR